MTRMTGPECPVMCNLINMHSYIHTYIHIYIHTYIHTYIQTDRQTDRQTYIQVSLIPPWEDQRERHRMIRMTRPDCAVMCNLINIHTYIWVDYRAGLRGYVQFNKYIHTYIWEDQRRWHRMTRMTRPDCAVMCNLINIHTYIHTYVQFNKYIHTYIHTFVASDQRFS